VHALTIWTTGFTLRFDIASLLLDTNLTFGPRCESMCLMGKETAFLGLHLLRFFVREPLYLCVYKDPFHYIKQLLPSLIFSF
jgi:hypothetical protein